MNNKKTMRLSNQSNHASSLWIKDMIGSVELKPSIERRLWQVLFLMLLLGFGGNAYAKTTDFGSAPANGVSIANGNVVSNQVKVNHTGGAVGGRKTSIRLRGACYLNDNKQYQNKPQDNGNDNTAKVTMLSGNDASISNPGYDGGSPYTSLEVCRVELWYDSWGGVGAGTKTDTRYFPVQQAIAWTKTPSTILVGSTDTITAKATTNDANTANRIDTGQAISYSSSNTGICTVNASGVVTAVGMGTCRITATAADRNTVRSGYPSGTKDLTSASDYKEFLIKESQSISISQPPPATAVPDASFNVVASASSGLAVEITVSGSCTRTAGGSNTATIKMTSAGVCNVKFTQPGNNAWAAAPDVNYTVTAAKSAQTITFPAQTNSSVPFNLHGIINISPQATVTSNLPINYSSLTPAVCSIYGANGNQLQMLQTGVCTIQADAAGTGEYEPADPKTQSIQILKTDQVISFTTTPPQSVQRGTSITVAAQSNSNLPVTLSWTGACVAGSSTGALAQATILTQGSGQCVITANQTGDANYNAAATETVSVTVTKQLQTIIVTQPADASYNISRGTFEVKAESRGLDGQTISTLNVAITTQGAGCAVESGGNNTAIIKLLGNQGCQVLYKQAGDADYEAAADQSNTVTVRLTGQQITILQAAPQAAKKDDSFIVRAKTDAPNLNIAITTQGECTVSNLSHANNETSATITMNSAEQGCSVFFDQAGNGNVYEPAKRVINVVRDGTAPVITETRAVASETNTTPRWDFDSSEAGSIVYTGACSSHTKTASKGSNSITFNALAEGTYSDCTVKVLDAANNASNILNLGTFTVTKGVKVYVAPVAKGAGDCSSWADACADIQQAIDNPAADEVWLAKGVYRPAESLKLRAGLALIGGFAGNEADANKANAKANITVISADIDANDEVNAQGFTENTAQHSGNNLLTLVEVIDEGIANEIEPATIKGVILNGAASHAVRVKASKLSFTQVRFIANAGSEGAALYAEQDSRVTVKNSEFTANTVSGKGAAIYSAAASAQITIDGASFIANTAPQGGAAIALLAGNLKLANATFIENNAGQGNGGAISFETLQSPSLAEITYSTFVDNSAKIGGAIYIAAGEETGLVSLANSLVLNNHATTAANISDMNKIIDRGYNIVGFNNNSGSLANNAPYLFSGTSTTSNAAQVDEIVAVQAKVVSGGFAPTIALAANSTAKDRIPSTHASCGITSTYAKDQNGKARPDLASGKCDVGAVEAEATDYCERVAGQGSGINFNQNPEDNSLCGAGWKIGAGASNLWLLVMVALLAAWRYRSRNVLVKNNDYK